MIKSKNVKQDKREKVIITYNITNKIVYLVVGMMVVFITSIFLV
jgi:hypothetical protein